MQLLFDNIASVLVASTVLLVVVATNLNAQRSAVESSVAYAAKTQTLSMASYMESDLLLIGNGTLDTIETITSNGAGQTTQFSFRRIDNAGADMLVSYNLTPTTTIDIDGQSVQLYRLDRTEDGQPAGGGSSTLSHFEITMLDINGDPTASVAAARLLRVRAVNVYPFGDPDKMNMFQSHWGITVRPPNLET
jgi:hypothetical protein